MGETSERQLYISQALNDNFYEKVWKYRIDKIKAWQKQLETAFF